jgi:two-component system sensor histidine kinase UhpB
MMQSTNVAETAQTPGSRATARPAAAESRTTGGERRVADRTLWQRASERERYRLTQQVHDDIGGILTGLKACIAVSLQRAAQAGLAPDPLLDDACALAELAFEAVRHIATDLRPAILDQLGVWGALEWHVDKLARRTNMRCELRVDQAVAAFDLGRDRELALYRIVHEALTNVERHACAWQLSVDATLNATELCVSVADDGVGMGDRDQGNASALGMRGMRERARAAGGTFTVQSQHNKGTVVRLILPLGSCDGH